MNESKVRELGAARVKLQWTADESPDLSYLGEYTDQWQPGAIDRGQGRKLSREYQYFVPCNSREQHRAGLIELGYSKGDADRLARSYVQQDYERMESYGTGWGMIACIAKVYVKGILLGRDSLWGIESDSDDSYFIEIERNVVHMAIADARANLRELAFVEV